MDHVIKEEVGEYQPLLLLCIAMNKNVTGMTQKVQPIGQKKSNNNDSYIVTAVT